MDDLGAFNMDYGDMVKAKYTRRERKPGGGWRYYYDEPGRGPQQGGKPEAVRDDAEYEDLRVGTKLYVGQSRGQAIMGTIVTPPKLHGDGRLVVVRVKYNDGSGPKMMNVFRRREDVDVQQLEKAMSDVNPLDVINGRVSVEDAMALHKAMAKGVGDQEVEAAEDEDEDEKEAEADDVEKGGGWQPVPGGKHGGERRRVGGKWQYRYQSKKHAQRAARHHDKKADEHEERADSMAEAMREGYVQEGDEDDHEAEIRAERDRAEAHRDHAHFSRQAMVKGVSDPTPLDLVKASGQAPTSFRIGSVTYHNAPAHGLNPIGSRPDLRRPTEPTYETAERDTTNPLDLVRMGPGILTHPNGKSRVDDGR